MKFRILVGAAVTLAALGLSQAPASANVTGGYNCNKTVNGGTINANVSVGTNATCILNGVTVNGNVSVGKKAYFEANGSTISGNVSGSNALTLYLWGHSHVSGNVAAASTSQVFVYDSTVGKNIGAISSVYAGYGHFQVCGSTVSREVGAEAVGPDILVGDPAMGCGANTIGGGVTIANNPADQEVYVIGNTVSGGNLGVYNSTGVGDKVVSGNNVPQGDLYCNNNSAPFNGTGNGTVGDVEGIGCSATVVNGNDWDE